MSLHKFQNLLGMSRTHVWRLRKAGVLKTTPICGSEYVMPDDLQSFNERAKSGEFAKKMLT